MQVRSFMIFVLSVLLLSTAVTGAEKKKKKQLELSPSIDAYFAFPQGISPNQQQLQQLAQLRQVYGPRLQAMAPAVLKAIGSRQNVKESVSARRSAKKVRQAGVPIKRLGLKFQIRDQRSSNKQSQQVIKQFQKIEQEIDQKIRGMLTPKQRRSLRSQQDSAKSAGSSDSKGKNSKNSTKKKK